MILFQTPLTLVTDMQKEVFWVAYGKGLHPQEKTLSTNIPSAHLGQCSKNTAAGDMASIM